MLDQLHIRRFRPQDQPAVWELHHKALAAIGADWGSGSWDSDVEDIESAYIKPGGEFLVGLIDDKIIAMGALKRISEAVGELKRMRVDPVFQQRGFGQAMLNQLELRAKELGFSELQLDTGVKQVGAQQLYKKNGYVEYKREIWKPGEMIFYRKILE